MKAQILEILNRMKLSVISDGSQVMQTTVGQEEILNSDEIIDEIVKIIKEEKKKNRKRL